ncbi:hypothetical protein KVT40_005992 [Elsinoe batatas]|uniref:Uncharacterized protein n=1 Tax=Elsinoe batatas TaxID=2601811 RepID=A0A8K0PDE2_9PEZI|nr:hypothetical protein KVT40_005992 [Elsinoe batatas]
MSSSGTRAFSQAASKAIRWVGATKTDIVQQNPGKDTKTLISAVDKFGEAAEEKYGQKADYMKIQGAKLHPSALDPSDPKEVLTVSIHTENGTSLESGHGRLAIAWQVLLAIRCQPVPDYGLGVLCYASMVYVMRCRIRRAVTDGFA